MGAPELPGDPGEEDLRPTQTVQHPALPSDDNSDNEANDVYGYQLLAVGDEMEVDADADNSLTDDDEPVAQTQGGMLSASDGAAAEVTHGDPNMPHIESADAEIERQVWSEPRPQELQLELDNARTAQILDAMSNFSLPNVVVPDWATGVPEERWKEELLLRIRQRKEPEAKGVESAGDTRMQHD